MLRPRSPAITRICLAAVAVVVAGVVAPVTGIAFPAPALAGPLPVIVPAVPAAAPDVEPRAQPTTIAVVKAPDADRGCQEIVNRIVAELTADGVSVVALTCPAANPACVADSRTRVSAIVLVQVRDNVRAVEVHASETGWPRRDAAMVAAHATPGTGRVQRVAAAESAAGPAALAVRTVEMLRAMLVDGADVSPARDRRMAVAPAAPVAAAAPTLRATPKREPALDLQPRRDLVAVGPLNVTLNVGVAMFTGVGGLSNAFGPAFSMGRRTSDHVVLSLALAGPAFGRDQENVAGTVSVRHELAAFQADLIGLYLQRLVLRVGMAAGVHHVTIEGHPRNGGFSTVPTTSARGMPGFLPTPMTTTGRTTGAFSGLLSWSAGLVANVRPDMGVYLDGRLFVLTPNPVVYLNGLEVGRVANPQLALTAGLEFRL